MAPPPSPLPSPDTKPTAHPRLGSVSSPFDSPGGNGKPDTLPTAEGADGKPTHADVKPAPESVVAPTKRGSVASVTSVSGGKPVIDKPGPEPTKRGSVVSAKGGETAPTATATATGNGDTPSSKRGSSAAVPTIPEEPAVSSGKRGSIAAGSRRASGVDGKPAGHDASAAIPAPIPEHETVAPSTPRDAPADAPVSTHVGSVSERPLQEQARPPLVTAASISEDVSAAVANAQRYIGLPPADSDGVTASAKAPAHTPSLLELAGGGVSPSEPSATPGTHSRSGSATVMGLMCV